MTYITNGQSGVLFPISGVNMGLRGGGVWRDNLQPPLGSVERSL